MGRVPYSEFDGARARFQRLSDQRVFSGWLERLRNDSLHVTAEDRLEIAPDEKFLFQVQGITADAYFIAATRAQPLSSVSYIRGATATKIVELPALNYAFSLMTLIQIRDAQQLSRRAVNTMLATIKSGNRTSEVLVTDASSGGMGIIAWDELKRGDSLHVSVSSSGQTAAFDCSVRHTRSEPRLIGAYRVGLQFVKPHRLDLVCWRRLIGLM